MSRLNLIKATRINRELLANESITETISVLLREAFMVDEYAKKNSSEGVRSELMDVLAQAALICERQRWNIDLLTGEGLDKAEERIKEMQHRELNSSG